MGTSCDALQQTERAQQTHDDIENNKSRVEIPLEQADREMLDQLEDNIQKDNTNPLILPEKTIIAQIKERYGSKSLREQWVTRLYALLDANPGIREMVKDMALMEMIKIENKSVFSNEFQERIKNFPTLKSSWAEIKAFGESEGINVYYDPSLHPTKSDLLFDIMQTQRFFTYSALPVNTLKFLYNSASSIVKHGHGKKLGKGVIGTLLVELLTPLKLARHDVSGAIYIMAKGVTSYTNAITLHVNRFLKGDVFRKDGSKRRKRGMEDVFRDMITSIKLPKEIHSKLKMPEAFKTDFLTRLLMGWMIWDKETGQYLIHSSYAPVLDESGQPMRYEETGDIMYQFQDPITLDEYLKNKKQYEVTLANLKPGQRLPKQHYSSFEINQDYIDMLEFFAEHKQEHIESLVQEARGIAAETYEHAKEQMEQTHAELLVELENYFPDLEKDDIAELLKSEDISLEPEFESLNKKQQKDLLFIIDAFGGYSLFEPLFVGMQSFKNVSENYYPVLYNQDYFHNVMWEEALSEAVLRLEEARDHVETIRSTYNANPADADVKKSFEDALKVVHEQKSLVNRMAFLRDRFDEYPMDIETGTRMPLARDVNPLKTITNAFDIRNARRDDGVYADYLRNLFGGIERNKLSVQLLRAVRKAEGDSVKKELVSLYKGIQNDPTAKSTLFGVPIDLDTVTRKLNNIGIKISPETASRKLRIFNSWITGMHLRQFSTAAVNATAIQESLFHVGVNGIRDAIKEIKSYPDEIAEIVEMSGIANFNEFITQGMINRAVDLDFTHDAAENVVMAMMRYWKDVSEGKDKQDALDELNKVVRINAETIPDIQRLGKRKDQLRQKKIQRMVNTFANYAINKEYEIKPHIQNIPYKVIMGGFAAYSKFITGTPFKILTMGHTESWLRQLQFVTGIVSARNSDMLPDTPISEYKDDVLEQAIEIGRQYVQMAAFSIGRENLGGSVRGEVGASAMKFKYYGMQKFGADVSRFQNAFLEIQDITEDSEPDSFLGTLNEMFGRVLRMKKYPQSVLRTTDPNVAQLRTFLMTQGLLTILVDTFIYGPFAGAAKLVPGVRRGLYTLPGISYVGGATSDLISLMWALPNLLIALSFGEGPDDDEWDDVFTYYMRRSFLGWGVTYTWESILMLASMLTESDSEDRARRVMRTLSPVVPKEVNSFTGYALENYLDDKLDW